MRQLQDAHIDAGSSTVALGDDVYEFRENTDTHFDVMLEGRAVAELGYLPGLIVPDVARSRLPQDVMSCLARAWGEYLRHKARI